LTIPERSSGSPQLPVLVRREPEVQATSPGLNRMLKHLLTL
jgi:hypothetical protein